MLNCIPAMIHIENEGQKKKPLTFLTNIFKRKKDPDENSDISDVTFEDANLDNGNFKGYDVGSSHCGFGRVSSSLSVHQSVDYMEVVVHPCTLASTLTLTPGRTRNLDRDMEALRLSRQDNPFLQVLASRESLADCVDESESDAAILMCHEQSVSSEQDPLTLPEVHAHMIRSPPPTTWPRSPNSRIFRFPSPGSDDESSDEGLMCARSKSPIRCQPSPKRSRSSIDDMSPGERSPEQGSSRMSSRLTPKPPRRCSNDAKVCSGFSLLQPPKRSHQDEEELLVASDRSQEPELPELPLLLSPPRSS